MKGGVMIRILTTFFFIQIFIVVLCCFAYAEGPGLWTTTLDNGMRVILLEDHSSELTASVICVEAGSRTESLNDNGLSHLLEHLLFDGTATRTREELARSVTSQGGYFNAFTRKDYVCFELVMPSDKIDDGLELQADQVLHSMIPPKELAKERQVVCEEIAKDLNSAYSAAEDRLMRLLYGNSGYGLPVIGNYHTVESISRDAILRFYKSRYVPNRMTAVVVGDFHPDQILSTLRKLYEDCPRGLDPRAVVSPPCFPDKNISQMVPAHVDMPYLLLAMPAPALTSGDALAAEAAVRLWASGETAPLKTHLTKGTTPLASQAHAWISHHDGFSILFVGITPVQNDNPNSEEYIQTIQSTVRQSFQTFSESEIDPDMLRRIQKTMLADHLFEREKFHHLARDIAHYNALGAFDLHLKFNDGVRDITVEKVVAIVRNWSEQSSVAVMVYPDDTETGSEDAGLSGTDPRMMQLDNGLKVIIWSDPNAPLMAYHLLIPVRSGTYPAGLPRVVAEMLDRGTETMTKEVLADRLADHGIRVKLADNPWMPFDNYYNSTEYSYLRMESLDSETTAALTLLKAMAFKSTLPEDALKEVKQQLTMLGARRLTRASDQSLDLLTAALFPGSGHSLPQIPSPRNIAQITVEQARWFYSENYQPGNCILSIVGNADPRELITQVEALFGSIPGKPMHPVPDIIPATDSVRKTGLVPSEQAYIRAALPVTVTPDNIAPLSVLSELLSGRMKRNIREEKGMAYRLGASVNQLKGTTVFQVAVGTRAKNAQIVEKDLRELLDQFRLDTFSDDEIRETVNSLIGHERRYRQRRINRAYYLAWQEFLGFSFMDDLKVVDRLQAVTSGAVQALLDSQFKPADQWVWSIVTSSGSSEKPSGMKATAHD
jgi:zinc protease